MEDQFKSLKQIDITKFECQLAVINEYKKERKSIYKIKYVSINEPVENKLKDVITRKVDLSNTFEEYNFDSPEPEGDMVRTMQYESTDFYKIFTQLIELNPEVDKIESIDELLKTKSYLIILRDDQGIQLIGFKNLPENWKLKRKKGVIPLLFNETRFEDLGNEDIFNISKSIDFIFYQEVLFILSSKEFEKGLNFREGMKNKANSFYDEIEELNLFVNLEILKNKVGDNQRYLRKIATIKNLGYYKNQIYLTRLKEVAISKGWNLEFSDNQIVINEDSLDTVLTLLQNKRLQSELTDETFDVESVKAVTTS